MFCLLEAFYQGFTTLTNKVICLINNNRKSSSTLALTPGKLLVEAMTSHNFVNNLWPHLMHQRQTKVKGWHISKNYPLFLYYHYFSAFFSPTSFFSSFFLGFPAHRGLDCQEVSCHILLVKTAIAAAAARTRLEPSITWSVFLSCSHKKRPNRGTNIRNIWILETDDTVGITSAGNCFTWHLLKYWLWQHLEAFCIEKMKKMFSSDYSAVSHESLY